MAEQYEICLGHVTGRCPKCVADDLNKQCSGYRPVTIYRFEAVKEEQHTDERELVLLSHES